jgi:hypothetical protein
MLKTSALLPHCTLLLLSLWDYLHTLNGMTIACDSVHSTSLQLPTRCHHCGSLKFAMIFIPKNWTLFSPENKHLPLPFAADIHLRVTMFPEWVLRRQDSTTTFWCWKERKYQKKRDGLCNQEDGRELRHMWYSRKLVKKWHRKKGGCGQADQVTGH